MAHDDSAAKAAAIYFEAWQARDFARLRSVLANDVEFAGALGQVTGVDECLRGLEGLSRIMTGIEIRKVFTDGPDVLTWYDMATSVAEPVPVANWMQVPAARSPASGWPSTRASGRAMTSPQTESGRVPRPLTKPGAGRRPRAVPWLAVAVLAGSQFLAVMSTTVVSVALPAIGAGLHTGPASLLWIVDAYVIVYSALLVVGGTIGDRRGRKGMFLLGLALFGAGSLADSLAPSTGWLLAARVLQGLGPVLLVPGSLTIIRALFDDERRRAQAIGLWSTGSGLGMAAGPVVGGLIAAHLGWRWVFGFNVPLAAVLLLIAARSVPRLDRVAVARRLDWAGTVLGSAGIAAIAFALIEGDPLGWTSPLVLAGFAVSACALAGLVARERRADAPAIDVTLFRRPAFTATNVAALVVFFAFIGAIVFFSAYFQQVGHCLRSVRASRVRRVNLGDIHLGIEPCWHSFDRPYRDPREWWRRQPSPWRGCR